MSLLQVKRNSTSQRHIVLDGITLEDTVGKAVHVSVLGSPNVVIKVTRSIFRRNGIRSTDQPSSNPTCQFTVIDASLNNHIVFEKTGFEENFAAHGVVVSHGLNTRLKNCYFRKNFVFREGVVVWGSLTIQNSNFLKSKKGFDFKSLAAITGSFISCMSISQVIITNSSFITENRLETHPIISFSDFKSLQTDDLTSIQCAVGTELEKLHEKSLNTIVL